MHVEIGVIDYTGERLVGVFYVRENGVTLKKGLLLF